MTLIRSRIVGHAEVDPAELIANPFNFRTHPAEQLQALDGSMEALGWLKETIVNTTTGHVIDGHARIERALARPGTKMPVTYVELSLEEELLALAVLDPITEMARRDQKVLDDLLKRVPPTDDPGLAALLAGLRGPRGGLRADVDEDDVPELPVEPITKPGDLYTLGAHRLLCGDSTRIQEVERLMDGQRADLIWTDPPYNVAVVGGTRDSRDKKNFGKGPRIENDSMGDAEFKQFLLAAFSCMYTMTSPGASVYVAHADMEGINFRSAYVETGFLLKQCLIWAKQQFVFGRSDYHWQHEPILYGWKDGAAHSFYGERNQSTLWNIDRPMRSAKEHPTQKPVALPERAILNSSTPGSTVLDVFGGGGSTLIACEKTGRAARIMEIDPCYCDVIVQRWEGATGQKAIRA